VNRIDGLDDVRTGLAADDKQHRIAIVVKSHAVAIFSAVMNRGDVTKADRIAAAPRDQERSILGGGAQLIVRADLPRARALLEIALRSQ